MMKTADRGGCKKEGQPLQAGVAHLLDPEQRRGQQLVPDTARTCRSKGLTEAPFLEATF